MNLKTIDFPIWPNLCHEWKTIVLDILKLPNPPEIFYLYQYSAEDRKVKHLRLFPRTREELIHKINKGYWGIYQIFPEFDLNHKQLRNMFSKIYLVDLEPDFFPSGFERESFEFDLPDTLSSKVQTSNRIIDPSYQSMSPNINFSVLYFGLELKQVDGNKKNWNKIRISGYDLILQGIKPVVVGDGTFRVLQPFVLETRP